MAINYNTNIGSIFHNNNGTDYVILAENPEKDYTMLLNMKNKITPFVCAWIGYYRQHITGDRILPVLGDDFFHALLPLDCQLLPCLSPAICQDAVFQVRLFQISHVNERHTTGVKRKEEHIPCIVQMRFQGQVKFFDALYCLQWHGTFHGLVNACVNMIERMFLFRQFLFHGTVIDGAEYAHIKGDGIETVVVGFQPCLIEHHCIAVYLAQKDVLPLAELHKTG